MEKQDFKQRINEVISSQKSANDFAKRCDLAQSVIHKYVSGQSKPTLDNLVTMAEVSGYNLQWLATGTGPEKANGQDEHILIPVYGIRADGEINGEVVQKECIVDHFPYKTSWIQNELHTEPETLFLAEITGDSMAPELNPGDYALIQKGTQITGAGIYGIRYGKFVQIRWVRPMRNGLLDIGSKNPVYAPETVDLAKTPFVSIAGRVILCLSKK